MAKRLLMALLITVAFAFVALPVHASTTYPSGRVVTTSYVNNRPTSVLNNGSNLATGISYKPFGNLSALTYGNGLSRSISYDNQYRISTLQTGIVQNLTYGYDFNANITGITNNLDGSKNKSYGYDALDRLNNATGPWGNIVWTYDNVGNRLTQTDGNGTATYSYQPNSNRIATISGSQSATYSFDANGNTLTENGNSFTYNQNQRLIQAAATQTGNYTYDASGQRASKSVNGQVTLYHYDQFGRLLAETDTQGTTQAEYLYLDNQPLAKIDATGLNYIHTDHLGTPQLMTDSQGAIAWQIESRPFGDNPIIAGTGSLNLRFPGQYFDSESNLHQNWFRDYLPGGGRYVETDPIGLLGGVNTYAYVKNSPVRLIDSEGLIFVPGAIAGGVVGGVGAFFGAIAQGDSIEGATIDAIIGAGVGAVSGGLPGLGGIVAGAGLGALTNLISQERNMRCQDAEINIPSVVGSAIGGAIGSRAGNYFGTFGRNSIENAIMTALPSLAPSTTFGLIGTAMGR